MFLTDFREGGGAIENIKFFVNFASRNGIRTSLLKERKKDVKVFSKKTVFFLYIPHFYTKRPV